MIFITQSLHQLIKVEFNVLGRHVHGVKLIITSVYGRTSFELPSVSESATSKFSVTVYY